MENFVIFISIIFGILSLILFFKVWGMCDNVKKIKKHLIQVDDFEAKFKFLMKIGEKERARDILINRILANRNIFSNDVIWDADHKAKKCFEVYAEELEALGIETPFPKEEKKD